ncbi:MAG: thioredoxin domain-containing protein, partial [Patulibacter sp.]|nr:thioredoxin domain-containing protein [Patulibacter sp.]
MANLLAGSSSPYLRQHADNPVDWRPWSQAALDEAAARDVPLLISIGYSACHWCHVMAHESFEDPAIAAVMNEGFVCIKVDREERPDLDAIYLDACQAMTGQGGWPLHAFATPDGRPFFAGTYYPPAPGRGLPGWTQVLAAISEAWRDRRKDLEDTGTRLSEALAGAAAFEPASDVPGPALLEAAVATMRKAFDSVHGGFGGAPKFPPSTALAFLLRRGELAMARYTLRSMAGGGIFDQVGGGFARYAVDATWTVPHFEKMLYDNALLAARYAEAAAVTGDATFGRVAERTLDWVLRDLGDDDGAFASALDADSGGVEGAYYVWTPAQVREVLADDDAAAAITWFGVTDEGNVGDGTTVLEIRGDEPGAEQAERILTALAAAREERVRPGRDEKRIVSWNALAITALATSAVRLGRADHLAAAERCAALILDRARDARGRVLRLIPSAGADVAEIPDGILDDHAHLLEALLALYDASFDARWFEAARELALVILRDFADPDRGGFFTTAVDHERLVARRKDLDDSPIPSGQATAALAFLRLDALTGDADLVAAAEG